MDLSAPAAPVPTPHGDSLSRHRCRNVDRKRAQQSYGHPGEVLTGRAPYQQIELAVPGQRREVFLAQAAHIAELEVGGGGPLRAEGSRRDGKRRRLHLRRRLAHNDAALREGGGGSARGGRLRT